MAYHLIEMWIRIASILQYDQHVGQHCSSASDVELEHQLISAGGYRSKKDRRRPRLFKRKVLGQEPRGKADAWPGTKRQRGCLIKEKAGA